MNAPTRSASPVKTRPVWSPVVSVWETVASSSHVVGMSSSVSPAASHAAVLMTRARLAKSLGRQYSVSSIVYDSISAG